MAEILQIHFASKDVHAPFFFFYHFNMLPYYFVSLQKCVKISQKRMSFCYKLLKDSNSLQLGNSAGLKMWK